jgi:hypothetical protein
MFGKTRAESFGVNVRSCKTQYVLEPKWNALFQFLAQKEGNDSGEINWRKIKKDREIEFNPPPEINLIDQHKIYLGHYILTIFFMLFVTACTNFKGTGKIPVCNEMHNNSMEINRLDQEIEGLEKKRIELSKHPEINFEKIQENEALLRQNKEREGALIKNNQRAAAECQPMFEDPARNRAKKRDF